MVIYSDQFGLYKVSDGTKTVYLRARDGALYRAVDKRSVRLVYNRNNSTERRRYITELTLDVRDVGRSTPKVPDPARRKLDRTKK